jgi:uncharacterized protein (DUF2141 family)
MLKPVLALLFVIPTLAGATQTGPELGKAAGRCHANEQGPAIMVSVVGLKDQKGWLKLEVYPASDPDFLADDNVLIDAGKTFRRVEVPVPGGTAPQLCIRIPGPGAYSLSLLHDRNMNHKFEHGFNEDGIGFSANPRLRLSQPKAAETRVVAGSGLTPISITMNYRRGLLSFCPLKAH